MASILTYFFNPYDRKARLQPALLTLLPIFAVVLLLIPQFGAVWATMGGLLSLLWRHNIADTGRSRSGKKT